MTDGAPERAAVLDRPLLPARTRRNRPRNWLIAAGLILLVAGAWFSVATVDPESNTDLLNLLRLTADEIARLRWQFLLIVVALAVLHYVATAVAARAASGLSLRMRELFLVQLAAAAANRLTPGGLGGSALTARYFNRRGMDLPAAIGAVSALAVLSALSNFLVLCAVVGIGSWLGLHGSGKEIHTLLSHVTGLLGQARSPWLWLAVPVAVALVLGVLQVVRRRSGRRLDWARMLVPVRELGREPYRLLTLVLASGCTTLILGFAFVATTVMVPGQAPTVGVGTLLLAFMLGSAAGSAIPIPAGLGSSEAAYIAVLLSVNVPGTQAVEEVLIFRLLTFWIPAAVGVLAIGYLRRRRAV